MHLADQQTGVQELRAARRLVLRYVWVVGLFSLFVNLLLLTGPLYMMQVFDRVLMSGSVETLVGLSLLMLFLYAVMGLLDLLRGRIMVRLAARFVRALEGRVFQAVLRKAAVTPDAQSKKGLLELAAVQRLLTSPVVFSVFDLPWLPVFFAIIFVFHPLLGAMALAAALTLVGTTVLHQSLLRPRLERSHAAQADAQRLAEQWHDAGESLRALGMQETARGHWLKAQARANAGAQGVVDVSMGFSTVTKACRFALQSVMLGAGAWLVLRDEMTAGGIFAGTLLFARGLAPLEALLTQWPDILDGRRGWRSLSKLLEAVPPEPELVALPVPEARVEVGSITVVPPGERFAALKSLSFTLPPGQALGVIGPSGAGKSTLARVLIGVWPVAGGQVTLGGAGLAQYGPVALGRNVGYLPQNPTLFEGTLAQNIARFDPEADEEEVIAAAQAAAAHEMILALPQGYDTLVAPQRAPLSGGQIQRIGLARALFRAPQVLVLDEPNANLDNEGSQALNLAIHGVKARGGAAIVMAHRPAAIQECDLLLVLEGGMRTAFGPKKEVLSRMVQNAQGVQSMPLAGGMR